MPSPVPFEKPHALSAQFRDSFAYPTLKDRVPIIICKVIDLLHRNRHSLEPSENSQTLKPVLEQMSQLRYELLTNKPLTPIRDDRVDAQIWNEYLQRITEEEGDVPKWFTTKWLYAECFAYRKLLECISASPHLADFDIFKSQKEEAFFDSLSAIRVLAKSLNEIETEKVSGNSGQLRHHFFSFLHLSLWGNKCDLSISAGSSQTFSSEPLEQVSLLKSQLLLDQSELVWDLLSTNQADPKVVDLVMDNAGFELFADFCLADFLVTVGLVKTVRLRVKCNPWFVSDTTPKDVDWLLSKLIDGATSPVSGDGKGDTLKSCESDEDLAKLGFKWKDFLSSGVWTLHPDPFWTYPHDFSLMKLDCPTLYSELSSSDLIVFKGDLNYRKLVGDLKWKETESFARALQGFHPANLVALRTLKADVVTGLVAGQAEKVMQQDKDWMVNGQWGLIQAWTKKN